MTDRPNSLGVSNREMTTVTPRLMIKTRYRSAEANRNARLNPAILFLVRSLRPLLALPFGGGKRRGQSSAGSTAVLLMVMKQSGGWRTLTTP